MTIRLATSTDSGAIAAIDSVAQHDPAREAFLRRHIEQGRCWVAEGQGRVIGLVVFEYSFYENGFVSLLVVRQDSRRRGVGGALLKHVMSICSTGKLFTSTNASNAPMRSLLCQHGFEPSGIIHNLDEGDSELVFFRRILR